MEDGVEVHRLRHPAGLLAPLVSHQTGFPALHRSALNVVPCWAIRCPALPQHFADGRAGVLRMGQARARLMSLHDHWLVCPTHVLWKNQSRACDRRTCFTCSLRSGLPPQLWRYTGLREIMLGKMDSAARPEPSSRPRMHSANGVEAPIDVLPLFSRFRARTNVAAVHPAVSSSPAG